MMDDSPVTHLIRDFGENDREKRKKHTKTKKRKNINAGRRTVGVLSCPSWAMSFSDFGGPSSRAKVANNNGGGSKNNAASTTGGGGPPGLPTGNNGSSLAVISETLLQYQVRVVVNGDCFFGWFVITYLPHMSLGMNMIQK
jgi:hypothetical protein